jgi:two-component system, sensor histidine kinase and response regulator
LRGDPARLRQILVNLVSNAVKFTETGEVVLRVTRVGGAYPNVEIEFTVSDTGIGIAADKQAGVFESFTQADNSTTRRFGGTGLGLTIASQLVALMDGRIWVESEPGKGSVFHFTVPFEARPDALPAISTRPVAELRAMRVLVVDDNAMNRRLLHEILTHWHMIPVLVDGGHEALVVMDRARQEGRPFKLVLLDFQMPDMDGFAVAEAIQNRPELSASTIMMLSSVGQRGDAARCKELGVAGYLTKPVRQSVLLDAIHAALTGGSSASPDSEPRALVTRHSVRESRGAIRVLLAEDNAVNRALVINLLTKRGHHVIVAENGREAVKAHLTELLDVVLMDVQMPDMDGFEATAVIRERERHIGKHIHIIALTAHAMTGDRERCLAAGMDGYLTKPVRPAELFDALEDAVSHGAMVAEAAPTPAHAASMPRASGASPSFDPADTLMRVGDDRELLARMVGMFRSESPRMMSAIRKSVDTGDATALARSAHALKGSVGNFGITESFDSATVLEQMGRDGILAGAAAGYDDLCTKLGRLEQDLSAFVGEKAG